jgi:serine/threonine-protein kinase
MANLIDQTLKQRYQVIESLGRGGMAEVYKVWDSQRGVHLAMKVLREDLAEDRVFLRRFQREAENLAKLQHPNIVRFYGLEQKAQLAFILMEFIEGTTLRRQIFDAGGPMPLDRVLDIMQPVCSALQYAHQMGLLHCDLKSGNIMLDKHGKVYITDFGIARMSDAATATLVGAGTPAYMAPELVRGEDPTPQTDIYALGVVLYEMLTGGERPFIGELATITGTTAEKVRWEQVNLPPTPLTKHNPRISAELEKIVLHALDKETSMRFHSCLELHQTLGKYLGEPNYQYEINYLSREQEAQQKSTYPLDRVERDIVEFGHANSSKQERKFPLGWILAILYAIGLIMFALAHQEPQTSQNLFEKFSPPQTTIPNINELSNEELITRFSRISNMDGMIQILIPAGEFLRGSLEDDIEAWIDEKPQIEIFLDIFWIDQTEVSTAQFRKCLDAGGCSLPKNINDWGLSKYYYDQSYEDYPTRYVSWQQANEYCQWVGRRLPTEAEWEKAARGTDGRIYPWGNEDPNPILVNFNKNTGGPMPVGHYPQGVSPYGALDMAGNVWEWVMDWYDKNYYEQSKTDNPQGPLSGYYRVLRGGFWGGNAMNVRTTHRSWAIPENVSSDIGFRCAQSAD